MKNQLKKDGTLEKKAIELITNLRSGNYKKLSYFYSSRTTNYPMVLNSDLFCIVSDKEVIVKEGFSPLTKAIVRINKENKYVAQTLKDLEIKDIEEENAKKQAEENAKKQAEERLKKMVTKMSKEELMDAILNAFPLEENEEYVGSLANHFRGRLKYDGAEVLIRSMCNVSLRQLIIYLQKIQN